MTSSVTATALRCSLPADTNTSAKHSTELRLREVRRSSKQPHTNGNTCAAKHCCSQEAFVQLLLFDNDGDDDDVGAARPFAKVVPMYARARPAKSWRMTRRKRSKKSKASCQGKSPLLAAALLVAPVKPKKVVNAHFKERDRTRSAKATT
jgi:hypothetical protein